MPVSFLFFSGLAGAGKTSMACVYGIWLAQQGKKALIVTTDPTPKLSGIFEQAIGNQVTPIEGIFNLWAREVDLLKMAPADQVQSQTSICDTPPLQTTQTVEVEMNGLCPSAATTLLSFLDFLETDEMDPSAFDVVIFDNALTCNDLHRLHLETQSEGNRIFSQPPGAGVVSHASKYARALAVLQDFSRTQYVFVIKPDGRSTQNTRCVIDELVKMGIQNLTLVVNGLVIGDNLFLEPTDERIDRQLETLAEIQAKLPYPRHQVNLENNELKGVKYLLQVVKSMFDGK